MIIKLLNDDNNIQYIESPAYKVEFVPCKSGQELDKILQERFEHDYRLLFDVDLSKLNKQSELLVIRLTHQLQEFSTVYVATNCRVYIMNNDGKTVDMFKVN